MTVQTIKTLVITTALGFGAYAQANTTYRATETTESSSMDTTSAPTIRGSSTAVTTTKTTSPSVTDQSNGTAQDVEVTRMIREELNKNDNLSVSAKNVEVITLNNTVTLRGKVASSAEKARVASTAKAAAGARNINNELIVDSSKR